MKLAELSLAVLVVLLMAGCSSQPKTAPQSEPALQPTQADAEKVAQQVSLLWNRQDYASLYDFFMPELREKRSKELFVKYAVMKDLEDIETKRIDLIYDKTVMGLEPNTAFAYYRGAAGILGGEIPAVEMRYNGTAWLINAFAGYFSDGCPPAVCTDSDPCTVDTCDESLECVHTEIENADKDDSCLMLTGARTSNKTMCSKIVDDVKRWTCYQFVAKQTGEVELCNQMPDWARKECLNAVKQSCQEGLFKNCCGNKLCEAGESGASCSDCLTGDFVLNEGEGKIIMLSDIKYDIKLIKVYKTGIGSNEHISAINLTVNNESILLEESQKLPASIGNLKIDFFRYNCIECRTKNAARITYLEIGE